MSSRDVFPLPLSEFEYYMYADDRPAYPMAFILQARLTGDLQRREFERSVRAALLRHPLFEARVRRTRRGCEWVRCTHRELPLEWSEDPEAPQPRAERLNLNAAPGIRIWVHASREQSLVTFQFHHSCCDGIGALQFIGDVLAQYGQQTAAEGDQQPELQELSPHLLSRRGDVIERDDDTPAPPRNLCNVVRKFVRLVGRKTTHLAAPRLHAFDAGERSLMTTAVLDRGVCRGLREAAKRAQVSLNDLYLREMFLTLRDWNADRGTLNEREWLRIGMPVSMRTPDHDGVPACNMVSFMFLPRKPATCDNEAALLESIREQTNRTLNERLGNWFLSGLRWGRKLPGLLPLVLWRSSRFATAVLANVGDIRKHFGARFPNDRGRCVAGNVVLERLDGVAPVRPGTRMAVSLGTYANQLIINMNCDRNLFSNADADDLLARFTARLERLADATTETKTDTRPQAA